MNDTTDPHDRDDAVAGSNDNVAGPPEGATPQSGDAGAAPPPGATSPLEGAPPPGVTPPSESSPRRLARSERDRMIGGVAAGLAYYLGLDPVLVRIAFVLLAIFGGTGLLAYLIAWVVIPTESAVPGAATAPSGAPRSGGGMNPVVAVLLIVGGFFFLANVVFDGGFDGGFNGGPTFLWALVLIGVGALLFRQDSRMAHAVSAAPAVPSAGPAAPAPEAGYAWPAPAPATPRRRSVLGRLTLAAVLLVIGFAAVLDNLRLVAVSPSEYVALALVTIGAGLIVGAWVGRAYWLIVVGALLIPPAFATNFLDTQNISFAGGVGERLHTFDDISEIDDTYRLGTGSMQLDFSDVALAESVQVDASVGAGELIVVVPDDSRVQVDGSIRAGEVNLFGQVRTYAPRDTNEFSASLDEGSESSGLLSLDLRMGLGEVVVVQDGELPFGDLPFGDPHPGGPFSRDRRGPFLDRDEPLFGLDTMEL